MALKYWVPVSAGEKRLRVRDILRFFNTSFNGRANLMTEYGATAEPVIGRTAQLMPLVGERWAHATGGWGVCTQFHMDNVQRITKLLQIPRSNGTTRNIAPGSRLDQDDIEGMNVAYGGNMALLYAVSILANQVLLIDTRALLTGGLNGGLEERRRIVWARRGTNGLPRNSGLAFMLEPDENELAIGAHGSQGSAQVDARIKWNRDTMCAMDDASGGVWPVSDLGLDGITVHLHLALGIDTRRRSVRIKERSSWGRIRFR